MLLNYPSTVNQISHQRKTLDNSYKLILTQAKFYWQRHRTRQQLAKLPEEHLHDIGITKEQALKEAQKPFWE